jgi:hypothetical protein
MRARVIEAWNSGEVGRGTGHLQKPYGSHANRVWHKLAEAGHRVPRRDSRGAAVARLRGEQVLRLLSGVVRRRRRLARGRELLERLPEQSRLVAAGGEVGAGARRPEEAVLRAGRRLPALHRAAAFAQRGLRRSLLPPDHRAELHGVSRAGPERERRRRQRRDHWRWWARRAHARRTAASSASSTAPTCRRCRRRKSPPICRSRRSFTASGWRACTPRCSTAARMCTSLFKASPFGSQSHGHNPQNSFPERLRRGPPRRQRLPRPAWQQVSLPVGAQRRARRTPCSSTARARFRTRPRRPPRSCASNSRRRPITSSATPPRLRQAAEQGLAPCRLREGRAAVRRDVRRTHRAAPAKFQFMLHALAASSPSSRRGAPARRATKAGLSTSLTSRPCR